jgi:phage-related protein
VRPTVQVVAKRDVELSDEVVRWYVRLGVRDRAYADRALDRLASSGSDLRMPQSRALGGGLHELRFTCQGGSRRITYALGPEGRVHALTTFRKQRGRERHEIDRAHRVLERVRSQARERERSR